MQSILLPAPAASSGTFPAPSGPASSPYLRRLAAREKPLRVGHRPYLSSPNSLSAAGPAYRSNVFPLTSLSPRDALGCRRSKLFSTSVASSSVSPASTSPNDDAEKAKLAQVRSNWIALRPKFRTQLPAFLFEAKTPEHIRNAVARSLGLPSLH